jgi:hypothetical protein
MLARCEHPLLARCVRGQFLEFASAFGVLRKHEDGRLPLPPSRLTHLRRRSNATTRKRTRLLSKHPRIDPERILVMGFSRGGRAAHWSAQKRFLAMHGPTGGQQFAGHIAFYPTCNRFFAGFD